MRLQGVSTWLLGLVLILSTLVAHAANQIEGVRVWPSPDNTRVVFDLKQAAEYSYFSLGNPDRLVIDFERSGKGIDLSALEFDSKLIKKIRTSQPVKAGSTRIVLELNHAARSVLFPLKPTDPYGHRLVVDLFHEQTSTAVVHVNENADKQRDVIIAVDAGHGGEDPGSIGGRGSQEKRVTLQIAKRLAKLIDAEPGMQAVMVRTGDYFVDLNKRSEIARRNKVDLLVSVHADAFTSPQPQGASVWVLSKRRANSEIGRWLEQQEKHSELLGGAAEVLQGSQAERYVAQAIIDMKMDYSRETGYKVAKNVLDEIGHVAKLHKRAPEYASLAVLKSPDIPSLLVETGFISNPHEEKLLNQSSHQQKLANAIHRGIAEYFKQTPPEGTLLASLKHQRKHKVQSGESLSLVARRYNITVSELKRANQLDSDTLKIGQVLTIPKT